MLRSLVLPLFFLLGLQLVAAQFNFFDNMWGQQQQHQQHQQRAGSSQWAAYADSISCSQYFCPDTLDCVARPSDCPCPNAEDVKCIVPDMEGSVEDATVICTRGQDGCAEVEKLLRKGIKPKKK
ncbi:hypothetical protein CVT25_011004 [Psilocybe cyanescens]|uniref:Long chronological lifespan protein 2 n=1 Tax=Psilocybe cyanescens TaxID=93625 RepID=A0A409WFZ2_PSICY|nr:hypothetical protein CVT25_011004 [Psilocybe cyanescens]